MPLTPPTASLDRNLDSFCNNCIYKQQYPPPEKINVIKDLMSDLGINSRNLLIYKTHKCRTIYSWSLIKAVYMQLIIQRDNNNMEMKGFFSSFLVVLSSPPKYDEHFVSREAILVFFTITTWIAWVGPEGTEDIGGDWRSWYMLRLVNHHW